MLTVFCATGTAPWQQSCPLSITMACPPAAAVCVPPCPACPVGRIVLSTSLPVFALRLYAHLFNTFKAQRPPDALRCYFR
jgi:hypothetical protein